MGANQTRREFCTWCALGLISNALPIPVYASRRRLLIGCLSTDKSESTVYVLLERELKAKLSDQGAQLDLAIREAASSPQQLVADAEELLALGPDVLICLDLDAALAAKRQRGNRGPPIVFLAHDDPLRAGLIQEYSRPGNNLTGITTFRCVDGKMVEILADSFRSRKRFGYLLDETEADPECKHVAAAAARNYHVTLTVIDVSPPGFISEMSARLAPLRLDAVVAPASRPLWQNRKQVVETLNSLRLPAIYESDLFLNEGGLMSYGPVRTDAMAQLALDVSKIIHGEAAGELAVEKPTLFDLTINLRSPNAGQYGIRASTLRRANRILQ
jgi:putative ABC transport system substrate-binding protein